MAPESVNFLRKSLKGFLRPRQVRLNRAKFLPLCVFPIGTPLFHAEHPCLILQFSWGIVVHCYLYLQPESPEQADPGGPRERLMGYYQDQGSPGHIEFGAGTVLLKDCPPAGCPSPGPGRFPECPSPFLPVIRGRKNRFCCREGGAGMELDHLFLCVGDRGRCRDLLTEFIAGGKRESARGAGDGEPTVFLPQPDAGDPVGGGRGGGPEAP